MKNTIITVLLGILLIGVFGAAVVSAVASDAAGANYGFGSMHRWAARYMDSGNREGDLSDCPYFNSSTVEPQVKTADEALEIARMDIEINVSKEDISQMGRWWIVPYENEDGIPSQARIEAVTGKVFTGCPVPAGPQADGRYARGQGHCRAYGY